MAPAFTPTLDYQTSPAFASFLAMPCVRDLSFPTRDRSPAPLRRERSRSHWTTEEVPKDV